MILFTDKAEDTSWSISNLNVIGLIWTNLRKSFEKSASRTGEFWGRVLESLLSNTAPAIDWCRNWVDFHWCIQKRKKLTRPDVAPIKRTKKNALVVLARSSFVIPFVIAAKGAWNNIPTPTPAIKGYISLRTNELLLLSIVNKPGSLFNNQLYKFPKRMLIATKSQCWQAQTANHNEFVTSCVLGFLGVIIVKQRDGNRGESAS